MRGRAVVVEVVVVPVLLLDSEVDLGAVPEVTNAHALHSTGEGGREMGGIIEVPVQHAADADDGRALLGRHRVVLAGAHRQVPERVTARPPRLSSSRSSRSAANHGRADSGSSTNGGIVISPWKTTCSSGSTSARNASTSPRRPPPWCPRRRRSPAAGRPPAPASGSGAGRRPTAIDGVDQPHAAGDVPHLAALDVADEVPGEQVAETAPASRSARPTGSRRPASTPASASAGRSSGSTYLVAARISTSGPTRSRTSPGSSG